MTLTTSNPIDNLSTMPKFDLTDITTGRVINSDNYLGKPMLIIFMCNHCPYVLHILDKLVALTSDLTVQDIQIIAINSNDIQNYPQDAPQHMRSLAQEYQIAFPYCFDATQKVAKDFNAACTPDFFLYNNGHKLIYHGQFDDARPGNNEPITGDDLMHACNNINSNVINNPKPSMGCNIKWKE